MDPVLLCEGICNARVDWLDLDAQIQAWAGSDPRVAARDDDVLADIATTYRKAVYRPHRAETAGLVTCRTCGAIRRWGSR